MLEEESLESKDQSLESRLLELQSKQRSALSFRPSPRLTPGRSEKVFREVSLAKYNFFQASSDIYYLSADSSAKEEGTEKMNFSKVEKGKRKTRQTFQTPKFLALLEDLRTTVQRERDLPLLESRARGEEARDPVEGDVVEERNPTTRELKQEEDVATFPASVKRSDYYIRKRRTFMKVLR